MIISTKTQRRAGRPAKRWEDDLNDLVKDEETEVTQINDLKNNNTWLVTAMNIHEWGKKDKTQNTSSTIEEPDPNTSTNTTSPATPRRPRALHVMAKNKSQRSSSTSSALPSGRGTTGRDTTCHVQSQSQSQEGKRASTDLLSDLSKLQSLTLFFLFFLSPHHSLLCDSPSTVRERLSLAVTVGSRGSGSQATRPQRILAPN